MRQNLLRTVLNARDIVVNPEDKVSALMELQLPEMLYLRIKKSAMEPHKLTAVLRSILFWEGKSYKSVKM